MKVTREEALRIAELARLEFDEQGLDRIAGELTRILEYVDQLREVDTAAVATPDAPAPAPMRDDEVRPSLERDAVEGNAPQWSDGFFVVPPVIGGNS